MSIAENMSAKERKEAPVWSGFINYFPDAIIAVAQLSRIGNEQHNPGKPLHWDRSKSGDELDALARHLIDAERVDTDEVLHATKVAWRAMANLQKLIEKRAAAEAHVGYGCMNEDLCAEGPDQCQAQTDRDAAGIVEALAFAEPKIYDSESWTGRHLEHRIDDEYNSRGKRWGGEV